MALADRLRTTRTDRGLSMAAAARELGVATSNYRMWELGYAKPEPAKWHPISTWLDIPFPTFLREEGFLTEEEEKAALTIQDKIVPMVMPEELADLGRDETHRLFEHAEALVERLAQAGVVSADDAANALLHIGKIKQAVREADVKEPGAAQA